MYRILRRLVLVLLVATFAAIILPTASSAAGPIRNGTCDAGEVCFYYNSNQAGSLSDMSYSLDNYGTGSSCNHFVGVGNGQGLCLKNNAASVWNRTGQAARVYFNSGFAGAYQDFASGAKGNLNATLKNQNASHKLLTSTPPPNPYGDNGCLKNGTQNAEEYLTGRTCPPNGFPYFPERITSDGLAVAQDPFDDGCSGKGPIGVPDRIPGIFDFREACALHDYGWDLVRWGTPGISKSDVDTKFFRVMNADCTPRNPLSQGSCENYAELYVYAVRSVNNIGNEVVGPGGRIFTR
jgi:hypothetical protein